MRFWRFEKHHDIRFREWEQIIKRLNVTILLDPWQVSITVFNHHLPSFLYNISTKGTLKKKIKEKSTPNFSKINLLTSSLYQEFSITLLHTISSPLRSEQNLKDKSLETLYRVPQPVHLGPACQHTRQTNYFRAIEIRRTRASLIRDRSKPIYLTDLKGGGRVAL